MQSLDLFGAARPPVDKPPSAARHAPHDGRVDKDSELELNNTSRNFMHDYSCSKCCIVLFSSK